MDESTLRVNISHWCRYKPAILEAVKRVNLCPKLVENALSDELLMSSFQKIAADAAFKNHASRGFFCVTLLKSAHWFPDSCQKAWWYLYQNCPNGTSTTCPSGTGRLGQVMLVPVGQARCLYQTCPSVKSDLSLSHGQVIYPRWRPVPVAGQALHPRWNLSQSNLSQPVPQSGNTRPSNLCADTRRYKYLRASQRVKTERHLHWVERGLLFWIFGRNTRI